VTPYDVAVIGLGAMGSMTALELARRGTRVIGFDRHHPPHDFGSSHGKSRIIRQAYFEDPRYVPLVQRAFDQWQALERAAGRRLLVPCGGVMIGRPGGTLVTGARLSARVHGLECEELTPSSVEARWPMFRLGPDEVALFEPQAGVLQPEAAVEAALELAIRAGLVARFGESVVGWDHSDPIRIRTATGAYSARRLVLALGPWMATALPGAALPLRVARQTVFWYDTRARRSELGPDRMPIFLWEWEPGRCVYGFPDLGDGVKLAIHHEGQATTADTASREVGNREDEDIRAVLASRAPVLLGDGRTGGSVCLYTNTPDEHFIVDVHPDDDRVVLVSPCSGHGFKFAPAIGEAVADLCEGTRPRLDLSAFRLSRFPPSTAAGC
jgi:sarcosine oxidase